MKSTDFIPGLSTSIWLNEPESWGYDPDIKTLSIVAGPSTDLIHEPLHSSIVTNAPALLFDVEDQFALSAKVSLHKADGKWSAGILMIWQDQDHWAKVCMERDYLGEPPIITVVTNGWSDDGVHWPVHDTECYLRVMRTGESLVMHASKDGIKWVFVRVFRFEGPKRPLKAGFLAQSPWGTGCEPIFTHIKYTTVVPNDVRDGT